MSSLNGKLEAAASVMSDGNSLKRLGASQNGGQEVLHVNPQRGVNGGLATMNPFHANYLESSSRGHVKEDAGRTSEEVNFDTITAPPPLENPNQNPADLFKPMFNAEGVDLFQAAKGQDFLHAERTRVGNPFDKSSSMFVDPFNSPSNTKDDLFRSPVTATTKEAGLCPAVPTKSWELVHKQEDPFMDIFSSSSANAVDPFPSPITRDLFQDVSTLHNPFDTTSSKQHNPFHDGTADTFKPPPPSRNVFGPTSSDTSSKATFSTPSLNGPSEMKMDPLMEPSDLFKSTPSESDKLQDLFPTTPQETKHDILQPSPFTRARNLSMVPSQFPTELTHVPTFKRPPKPLPRSRPPRAEKPPRPEKPPKPASPSDPEATVPKPSPKPPLRPLPKPVCPPNPKPPESKPLEAENSPPVFEDVLLIGQERCVEDWPEDSPEFSPDFKPAGTFRLRRESLKLRADSDGGSGDDQGGADGHVKKKERKFRLSLISRRGSKEKFPDDTKVEGSRTLPRAQRSSKDYSSEASAEKYEDVEQNGMDYSKNYLKTKVSQLRRAATFTSAPVGKDMNGHFSQDSKGDDIGKKGLGKNHSVMRQWSEGPAVYDSSGEEEEGGEGQFNQVDGLKKKKKVKIRFVPQRGFAITVDKKYKPRKSSKDKSSEEYFGAHGYSPSRKYQDDVFDDLEEKSQSPRSPSKAAFMDDELFQKTRHPSAGLNGDADPYGTEDCKPRKPTNKLLPIDRQGSKEDMLDDVSHQKKKSSFSAEEVYDEDGMEDCKPKKPAKKLLPIGHRNSKEDMLDDVSHQKKKSSFSAEEVYDEDGMEDCKPKSSKHKVPPPVPRKPKTASGLNEPIGFSHQTPQQAASDPFAEEDFTEKAPAEMYDSDEDEVETYKQKKSSIFKGFKKHKSKESKATPPEWEDPPGAASGDFLSEAAQAEWIAAQMDERALEGLEDEDEDGDTDSLMEWWDTVEQWDEVPSDDEDKDIKEDESKSFTILADKVLRGLRVFNKVFTERAEVLWQSVIMLHAIADNINDFHHKAKIAGITGGTTTAVGGVTAIAGLALAPFTLGASLVITAVGVGVATAGGIASASAAISDNVNNMHDRKKVELVLQEYEGHLLALGKILHFVNLGLYKLRGHPFLRSGTQHYSKDWEVRRAVQMISLVDNPVFRGTEITDASLASVQGLFKGMDKYFIKDSRELKKGCKKEVVAQIKEVANVLNDGIVELNAIREELQDATGNI